MLVNLVIIILIYVLGFFLWKESENYNIQIDGAYFTSYYFSIFIIVYASTILGTHIVYYFLYGKKLGTLFTWMNRLLNTVIVGNLITILSSIKDLVIGWNDYIVINPFIKIIKIWDLDTKFQFLMYYVKIMQTPANIRPSMDELKAIAINSGNRSDIIGQYHILLTEKIARLSNSTSTNINVGWWNSAAEYAMAGCAVLLFVGIIVIGIAMRTGDRISVSSTGTPTVPQTDISVPVSSMGMELQTEAWQNATAFFIGETPHLFDKNLLVRFTREFCQVRPISPDCDVSIEGTMVRFAMRKIKAVMTTTNDVI